MLYLVTQRPKPARRKFYVSRLRVIEAQKPKEAIQKFEELEKAAELWGGQEYMKPAAVPVRDGISMSL